MSNSMDSKFLEFWGHLMLNAAQGQKQIESFQKWLGKSADGLPAVTSAGKNTEEDENFMSVFAKVYGADKLSEGKSSYLQIMQNAAGTFQTSFEKYIRLLGAVPRDEHVTLQEKYEALDKKVSEMEKTIALLQAQLGVKPDEPEGLTQGIKDLVVKQGEQFQDLMQNFQKLYKENDSSSSEKK
ncbi:hypothetical protein QUF75_11650 [Desulfococcaceae bacterium HSG7]|nr:hypothetical protein [Desulfococcaceae bacterium HSG7]